MGRRKRHQQVDASTAGGVRSRQDHHERVRGGAEFGQSIVNASVEADFYSFSDAGQLRRSPPGATTRSTDGPAPASTGPSEPRCRPG